MFLGFVEIGALKGNLKEHSAMVQCWRPWTPISQPPIRVRSMCWYVIEAVLETEGGYVPLQVPPMGFMMPHLPNMSSALSLAIQHVCR